MMKKVTKEFVRGKTKSALEKGRQHHNFVGIGCWAVFPFRWLLLNHLVVREKAILNQFEDFALICGGFLEHLRMGGGHGAGKRTLGEKSRVHGKEAICARKERNGGGGEEWFRFWPKSLFIGYGGEWGPDGPQWIAKVFGEELISQRSRFDPISFKTKGIKERFRKNLVTAIRVKKERRKC
jgi:hypothetical protein